MTVPDSLEREKRLNCKIIAGVVYIADVGEFLSLVRTIARTYGVTIQAMNAELVAGEGHITSAVKKALRAVERKRNITSDLGLEILLYAAGRRQIERALAMGVSEGEQNIALVIVAAGEKDLEAIAEAVKREAGIREEQMSALELEYNAAKRAGIKTFFDITDAELRAVGEKKLKLLVLERVAMLDVLK